MPRMDITEMAFARVYPLLVTKAEKKGRTRDEVDQVTAWLTGYTPEELAGLAPVSYTHLCASEVDSNNYSPKAYFTIRRWSLWYMFFFRTPFRTDTIVPSDAISNAPPPASNPTKL